MDDSGIKKQNWDVKETELFLEILKELDMKKCLDGRKVRNNTLFKVAHRRMTAAGYHRSVDQLKFRWKLLKSAYYKCKREPDSPTPIKIQGWWRYEQTMIAIMESRHPLVGAGVKAERSDEVTEDSDGEALMLHWPQPCPDSGAHNNSTIHNLDLIVGLVPRRLCCLCHSVTPVKNVCSVPSPVDVALGVLEVNPGSTSTVSSVFRSRLDFSEAIGFGDV